MDQAHRGGRGIFQTVRGRLFLVLLSVILPVVIIQLLLYRDHLNGLRNRELRSNLEVARIASEYFDRFVRDVLREEMAIGLAFTSSDPLSSKAVEPFLNGVKYSYDGLQSVSWVGPKGRIRASSEERIVGLDISERPFFKEILGGREWAVSGLLRSKLNEDAIFTICLSMRERSGSFLGIVMVAVHADRIEDLFSVERFSGGDITLIDRNGRAVCRYPATEWTWKGRNLNGIYPEMREVLEGKEISGASSNALDGERHIFAMTPIRSIGWVARASRPEAETLAPAFSQVYRNASLFLLVVVASFFISMLVTRRISAPIRKLRTHALALRSGRWSEPVRIHGAMELEELAQAFNSMAEEIRVREERVHQILQDERNKAAEMEAIFSSLSNMVIVCDDKGKVVKTNIVLKDFGLNPLESNREEIAKRLRIRRFDGGEIKVEELPTSRTLRGETIRGERYLYSDSEGRERIGLVSATTLLLGGKPYRAVSVLQDITELQTLHQEIEARGRLLQEIIDNAPAGIAIFDARSYSVNWANNAYRAYLKRRYGIAESKGIRIQDYLSRSETDGFIRIFQDVLSTGRPHVEPEYEHIDPDGTVSYWHWSLLPLKGTDEKVESLELLAFEITKQVSGRKRAEEAHRRIKGLLDELEVERARLKAVFNNAPAGIVVTDERCRILMANPLADRLYARPVFSGEGFESRATFKLRNREGIRYNLTDPRDLPFTRSVLDGETHTNVEFSILWPDGQARDLLANSAPIRAGGGEIKGAVGVLQDITDIKEGERERQELLSQVKAYSEELEWINDRLNSQAEELSKQGRALQKARDELEQKVQERTAELQKANSALKDLSSRLLTAHEEERKGIARDLHDTLLQKLAYIKMSLSTKMRQLGNGGSPPDRAFMEEIISLVADSIEDARATMEDLRPSMLDHFGIVTTIESHCREYKDLHPLVELEEELEIDEEEIPESLKLPLFRVLQEALNNAAKHSRADRIEVFLCKSGNSIRLEIADNGVGFEAGRDHSRDRKGGFGLTSMKERTELSGGTFSIRSQKDQGTTLVASWVLGDIR